VDDADNPNWKNYRDVAGIPTPVEEEPRIYRLRSVSSLKESCSYDYLIKGWLAAGEREPSVIYGEPGSGKTFAALHIGYSLSLGLPVFGRRVRQMPVLYVCLEGGLGFERRLRAISERMGKSDYFYFVSDSADLHGSQDDQVGISAAARRCDAKLIIVDTMARALGGGSEIDGKDMAQFISGLALIAEETGASILLVHHTGKNVDRGMRGHSSLHGATITELEVSRSGDSRTLKVVKSKDGKDGEEHAFSLEVVELGLDDDGEPVTTCLVREEGQREATQKKTRGKLNASLRVAQNALHEALIKDGYGAPPSEQIPPGANVVSIKTWKERAVKMHISVANTEDSNKKAFGRAMDALQAEGIIGVWNGLVWLKPAA
jgi:hypothetical protein